MHKDLVVRKLWKLVVRPEEENSVLVLVLYVTS